MELACGCSLKVMTMDIVCFLRLHASNLFILQKKKKLFEMSGGGGVHCVDGDNVAPM